MASNPRIGTRGLFRVRRARLQPGPQARAPRPAAVLRPPSFVLRPLRFPEQPRDLFEIITITEEMGGGFAFLRFFGP